MTSVSKKRAKRQQEKRVKRMNLINEKKRRRRKQHPGKILTPQQRRKRNETIKKSIERKAERKKLRAEKRLHDDKQRKITKVHSLFPSLIMASLAKSTNFIRRQRELSAFAFVYMMSFCHLGNADISLSGLTSLLSTDFCEFITPAGLCKRINSKNSPAFLKSMLEMLMARGIDKLINRELKNGLSMFSSVLIEDSTQIALNAMAATKYGGQVEAQVNLLLKYIIRMTY